ncbi:P-loop containing nucleoside triphosphate hydrolase protein [Zalerion maritima]|uniref:P-loop containing nucleoside triphosphate hydrolase protein n=1 Tax=Zalerion maritima TaxID=339359 RepID=A0AAD5RVV9_9PEZI|nr:P-loop containing nucleoside triphosphate hydrolase protein [Zalerion maritima]
MVIGNTNEKSGPEPPTPVPDLVSPAPAPAPAPDSEAGKRTASLPKTEEPSGPFWAPLTIYLHLLFTPSGPTSWLDTLLLLIGLVTAIASGVPFPLMGILFGELVDDINLATCEASEEGTSLSYRDTIQEKVVQLVYISVAAFVLIYVYTSTWSLFSQRLSHKLRESYFRALLRQDPTFFDSRHAGEVSARLNGDIQAVASGTGEKVGIFLASISFFVTAYIVGFVKDAQLAGILISLVPAFLLMSMVGGIFLQKFIGIASDKIATGSKIVSEALDNVAVVQAFGMGRRLETRFAADMLDARKAGIKKSIVSATQAGLLFFIAYSANALAFWQGSRKIAAAARGDGDTSVGEIYTVVFLLVDACVILGSVAPLLPLFGGAASSYQKLRDDIEKKSLIDGTSGDGDQPPADTPGAIRLSNVSFAYPSRPEQSVLKSVDLYFPAGKHTGIVGLSGSGKSTVASLVSRLYDPASGSVALDGRDIRELNVRGLRGLIGLVPQEPSLLDRSVFENIALGLVNSDRPEHQPLQSVLMSPKLADIAMNLESGTTQDSATNEIIRLVRHAADLAEVSAFIANHEDGWATKVGSGGNLVSGGQRQRIALARALVKDPRILVLDEATASLDSTTEGKIQDAVHKVSANRTVISIAHRLSTIKDVDSIVVMRAGEVVEQGTYTELMSRDGAFSSMVKLQGLGGDEDEGDVTPSASGSKASLDEKAEHMSVVEAGSSSTDNPAEPKNAISDVEPSLWTVAKGIGSLCRPYLGWIVLAIVAAVIVGCTFSASGLLFGNTVGALNPCSNTVDRIYWAGKFFGGLLFMLACIEFLANLASWSAFGLVAERLVYRVRVLGFRSLFEKGVEWHRAEGRSPSTLLSVITKDSVALHGFSGSILGTIFSITVNFLVAIILSHIIAWKIALVFLITVPVLLGSGVMQLRAIASFERKHADAFSSAIAITVEAVSQIKTIATLGLEKEVLGTYKRTLAGPKKAIVGASLYTNLWLALANSTGFLIYAFAYWWGSKLIMDGEYSQTQFFIILVAVLVSAQLWGQMFSLAPEVSRAKSAAGRLLTLINASQGGLSPGAPDGEDDAQDAKEDVEATAESKPVVRSDKGINLKFDSVTFAYPSRPSAPVLSDVSFTIQPGQFVGLVGPSGAGKSTIMALAQQLYSCRGNGAGSISIDGNTNISTFKDDVAVVPQDSSLFSGSISFNISLGAREGHVPSDEEIREACELANIDSVVTSLPGGYDTDCGPSASRLSGGQKQRLAIARALVRKPRLLLLDESTSALDAESEAAVQEGLAKAVREKGVSVLAITHRLHTVMKADVILVVEGGRIVDKGTHGELVERCESYRRNALGQVL